MADQPVEYRVEIARQVPNPKAGARGQYSHEPDYTERTVTTVTLDAEQWRKIQAAIVEVLK